MKVSIVVGYYNEHEAIRDWITSQQNTLEDGYEYEFIVVSDKQHSRPLQCDLPNFTQIYTRSGYTRAFNDGLQQATGEYIVISNADSLVLSPSWLSDMIATQKKFDAAIVGCPVHGYMAAQEDYTVDYGIPSFFWLFPKDKLLLFDERYAEQGGAYFDDYDHCFECFKRGWPVAVCVSAPIKHTGAGSMNRDPSRNKKRQINAKIYEEKWGVPPRDLWLNIKR